MRETSIKQKRISFNVDRSLSESFKLFARRKGVSESSLLRHWLLENNNLPLKLKSSTALDKVLYTFRISDEEDKKLQTLAEENGLNKSIVLRNIIANNLAREDSKANSKSSIPNSDLDKIVVEIKESIQKGNLAKAKYLVEDNMKFVDVKGRNILDYYYSHILRFELDHFKAIPKIANLIAIGEINSDRTLLGVNYFQLGELYDLEDKKELSLKYFIKALNYLDSINHPEYILKIYAGIATYHLCNLQLEIAETYYSEALTLANQINKPHVTGRLLHEMSILYAVWAKYEQAEKYNLESIRLASSSKSAIVLYHAYDKYGRLSLQKGDIKAAHKYISLAYKIEHAVRPNTEYSRPLIFKHFLEAEYNYGKSIHSIRSIMSKNKHGINKNVTEYIFASTQYLKAHSEEDQNIGEYQLLSLAKNPDVYPLMQQAALNTIKSKRLQYIR